MTQTDFLKDLEIEGTLTQIGTVNKVMLVGTDCSDFIGKNMEKDLYFLANVDPMNPMRSVTDEGFPKNPHFDRASDADIISKRYFYLDFDIRKELLKKLRSITDDELITMGKEFGEKLKSEGTLGNWRAIVFTGNGIHVYYVGDPVKVDLTLFRIGMEGIMSRAEKACGMKCDHACKNPARIARLPGSFNNKGDRRQSSIISYRVDVSFDMAEIQTVAKKEKERSDEMVAMKDFSSYKTDEEIESINMVPVAQEVLVDYPTWTFDGKNFWESDGSRASSAWVNSKNVLILSDSRWFDRISKFKGVGTFLYRREMSGLANDATKKYFRAKGVDGRKIKIEPKKDYRLRYTWGTRKMDTTFAIIKRSDLIIFAGKRGNGKTVFTFDMACKNAEKGHKVLYISLEMDTDQIFEDIARRYGGITIEEELDYKIPDIKQSAFDKKVKELKEKPNLFFRGMRRGSNISIEAILEIVNEYPDIDMIIIDNLDRIGMRPGEKSNDKQIRIIDVLMSFTSGFNIPVLLIHHHKKGNGKNDDDMDEISGSGKITDGGDRVLKIVRNKDPEAIGDSRYETKIYLQKARGYHEAMATIYFNKGRFQDDPPSQEQVDIAKKAFGL